MKKVIGIVMAILIILFVICNIIFFNIFGNNKYDLKNISDSQKKEINERFSTLVEFNSNT